MPLKTQGSVGSDPLNLRAHAELTPRQPRSLVDPSANSEGMPVCTWKYIYKYLPTSRSLYVHIHITGVYVVVLLLIGMYTNAGYISTSFLHACLPVYVLVSHNAYYYSQQLLSFGYRFKTQSLVHTPNPLLKSHTLLQSHAGIETLSLRG